MFRRIWILIISIQEARVYKTIPESEAWGRDSSSAAPAPSVPPCENAVYFGMPPKQMFWCSNQSIFKK